jgi:hypothetical protein
MTTAGFTPLGQLLRGGELAALVGGARERSALTQAIRELLPPEEAGAVVGAHWENEGTLVLSVNSGAWAARLRYRQTSLGAQRVRVTVAPPSESQR